MCELDILHDSLYQFCPELHLKRLNSLTLACHALLDCKTLTLTELGRNLPTKARTKHNIKRIDRLLGNRHLHKERLAVYRWHASFICSGNTMPIVLVDWSDIREQKRLMVLRASVALHGRSVTLYEKAFPLSEQCSKKAHDQFLADLASILPSNTTPLIVSDAGFKVPWYKSVEKLGWYWLSRVRGKVQYADLGAENWKPISNLHDMSSSHSKTLGYKRLTKSNPISCQILLYKSRSKGRKNQRSTRTHCHHPSPKIYSASAKEPWILASKLLDCQLITVVAQGKHRYFRLAGKDIAELMESMMGISLNHGVHAKVSTPVHLRKARTCYDHLAGEVAVKIYDSLCQQQWITENGSMITLSGIQYFHEMGIDVPSKHSRKICCACLDWSERRFHLGGYVGAALFSLYESKGWLTRHLGYREVTITEKGYAAFKTHFHI